MQILLTSKEVTKGNFSVTCKITGKPDGWGNRNYNGFSFPETRNNEKFLLLWLMVGTEKKLIMVRKETDIGYMWADQVWGTQKTLQEFMQLIDSFKS